MFPCVYGCGNWSAVYGGHCGICTPPLAQELMGEAMIAEGIITGDVGEILAGEMIAGGVPGVPVVPVVPAVPYPPVPGYGYGPGYGPNYGPGYVAPGMGVGAFAAGVIAGEMIEEALEPDVVVRTEYVDVETDYPEGDAYEETGPFQDPYELGGGGEYDDGGGSDW